MASPASQWLAPPGCTSIDALEPTPNLDGKIDWARERETIVGSLRERVAALGYPTEVVMERVYDPRDWEELGMERGTPFALAHTFFQSGPVRPNNVDKRVPGLVFTGSSAVPGVGVPLVLVSGKLAAQRGAVRGPAPLSITGSAGTRSRRGRCPGRPSSSRRRGG